MRMLRSKPDDILRSVLSRAPVEGAALLQALDGKPEVLGQAGRLRITELIADLQRLEEIRLTLWQREPAVSVTYGKYTKWPRLKFDDEPSQKLNHEGEALLHQVNRHLRRYKWSPGIALAADQGLSGYVEHVQIDLFDENYLEKQFVMILLYETTNEAINRFRQCQQCRRWFYAMTDHQKYCDAKCRQHHASTSPQYKEKRRFYMRSYRREEKTREMRAKKLARGK